MTQDATLLAPLAEKPYRYMEGKRLWERLQRVRKLTGNAPKSPYYQLNAGQQVEYRTGTYFAKGRGDE